MPQFIDLLVDRLLGCFQILDIMNKVVMNILVQVFVGFKIIKIYLIEHKQEDQQAEGKGEAGSLLSRKPDVGLDTRTLGSWPEPKVAA